jgi:hypothetical protein
VLTKCSIKMVDRSQTRKAEKRIPEGGTTMMVELTS